MEGIKMRVIGIGTAGYQMAWHQAGKAERNAASGAKTFMETDCNGAGVLRVVS